MTALSKLLGSSSNGSNIYESQPDCNQQPVLIRPKSNYRKNADNRPVTSSQITAAQFTERNPFVDKLLIYSRIKTNSSRIFARSHSGENTEWRQTRLVNRLQIAERAETEATGMNESTMSNTLGRQRRRPCRRKQGYTFLNQPHCPISPLCVYM